MDSRIKLLKEGKLGTRPSWDEHGMLHAIASAPRSTCRHVRSGSAFVLNRGIIGTGYNGAPAKIKSNCLSSGCRKEVQGLEYHSSLGSGECIGVHSEKNALRYSRLSDANLGELHIYNTIFPCHACAKELIPYARRFIFKRLYSEKELDSTLRLFEEANVEICQLDLTPERFLDIYFNIPDVDFDIWSSEEKERIKNFIS